MKLAVLLALCILVGSAIGGFIFFTAFNKADGSQNSQPKTIEWETLEIEFRYWVWNYVEVVPGVMSPLPVRQQLSKTLVFYVANTPEKRIEGFKFKDCIDFQNKSAVGMVFPFICSFPKYVETASFTMKDVKFPLALVLVSLSWEVKEKTFWRENESRYEVLNIWGSVITYQIVNPGEEQINVSLKDALGHAIIIEMDPEVFQEMWRPNEIITVNILPKYAPLLGIPP